MSTNVLHTTVLLQALIAMLHDEGVDITTSAALNIEKVLFNTDLTVHDTFSKLKFRIVPIISRNKEEQDNLYKIFDRLDEKAKKEEKVLVQPIDGSQTLLNEPKKEIEDAGKFRQLISSRWFRAALIGFILLIGAIIYLVNKPSATVPAPTARITYEQLDLVKHDTVHFRSVLPKEERKDLILNWRFPDTTINNQWEVTRIIPDADSFSVTTTITRLDDSVADSSSISIPVLCEKTPDVILQKLPDEFVTNKWSNKGAAYAGIVLNASKDSANYRYHWFVNDIEVQGEKSDQRLLATREKYNENVRLIITWDQPQTHCSTDSLGAEINDGPAISATITGDQALQIKKETQWNNVALTLLLILIVPLIPAFIIYKLLKRKRQSKQTETPEPEPENDGPYSINFKNQQHVIHTEHEIEKLADVLRKRQVSDISKLNIRRTIYNTVRSGGLPQLAYTPVTKASDYLVFIDKGNTDSYLAKLFEYLLEKLKKDQVNLDVYEYQKEPLFLTNEKLNHNRIPVDKIAALYPGRTLFIFGDTRHFVFSLKGKLKDWLTTKLGAWKTKIIVTPYSKNDWDKKEQLLTEANFVVIPADLKAQAIVEAVVSGQIDIPSQSRFIVPTTYAARFLNFQEFENLQSYLNDDNLLKWVCSLAIYSTIDWSLTLAIGKAIENDLQQKGKNVELVTYTNLLKLGRISWLDEGIIPDTIRVKMLEYIDNETEALARQTLVDELGNLKEKILPGSLLKREFDVHEKINSFLVSSYNNQKPSHEDTAFLKDVLAKDELGQAHEIYLKRGDNTLVKSHNKNSSVGIDQYFNNLDRARKMFAAGMSALVFVAIAISSFIVVSSKTDFLHWNVTKPSTQTFVFIHPGVPLDGMFGTFTVNDSFKVFNINSDTITLRDVMVQDSSRKENFKITGEDNKLLSQNSIKLNSTQYTVNISRPVIVPAKVFYSNQSDQSLADLIQQNLPSNFDVSLQQKVFRDTSTTIRYYTANQKKDAELAGTLLSSLLKKNVPVVFVQGNNSQSQPTAKSKDTYDNNKASHSTNENSIEIFVANPAACTPLTAEALPKSLSEIWKGETNNRFVNINLAAKIFYYSTGGTSTYGTYRINDACLMRSGTYKIISKTDKGYSLFFIKNITQQGFELSVCQQPYKSKEELQSVDENSCGAFNRMSLYYESDPNKIYLPVKSGKLANSEQQKIEKAENQINFASKKSTVSYVLRYYKNGQFGSGTNAPSPEQYLSAISKYRQLTRGDMPQVITTLSPFHRNYFTLAITAVPKDAPVAGETDPAANSVPVNNIKKETPLGNISLDEKGYPDPDGLSLIKKFASQLISATNSFGQTKAPSKTSKQGQTTTRLIPQMRFDASFTTDREHATLTSAFQYIKNLFAKEGVTTAQGALIENITQTVNVNQNAYSGKLQFKVVGIYFDAPLLKSAN